jgi:hypothetical protein
MLCLHPNLIYALSVMNSKKIKQALDLYDEYYFTPVVGKEDVWISVIKLVWQEILKNTRILLNSKYAASMVLSTDDAAYLQTVDNSLNLGTRLKLLDGSEIIDLSDSEGSISEVRFINGPYNLDNLNITINNAYINVVDRAVSNSKTLTESGILSVQLIGINSSTIVDIDIAENTSVGNFFLTRKLSNIELSLVGSEPYYCFNVIKNDISASLGLDSGFIDSNSVLFTSSRDFATRVGGSVDYQYALTNINIVDGVSSVSFSKCVAVLLDRNNELVCIDGNTAYNYCNTSLTYSGKVRIIYEYVSCVLDNNKANNLPSSIVSYIGSNNVRTSYANCLSTGDIIVDGESRLEVINISDTLLRLSGRYYSKNLNIVLGCYDTWRKMTDGLTIPSIIFPESVDSNTIIELRKISSIISQFVHDLRNRLLVKLTRNQLSSAVPYLNEIQKQHLAMRANRACDILFSGDIATYLLLDDNTCNYALAIKQSTDELKARL